MNTIYHVKDIRFDSEYMFITVNNQMWKVKLSEVSKKLSNATSQQLSDFTISPSGYGIHWKRLDEDLSINGLLKQALKSQ